MAEEPEYLRLNRAWWDERAPIHAEGDFYDLDGFVAGHDTLLAIEDDLVGPVDGLDLVHLQCHLGMDTLSWARRGARVTGLDFSVPAIETARSLAERIGVDARFEVADVYDAVEVLDATYDIAYQSLGSLIWHPDMPRWAAILADLVRPGGRYVLLEAHPFAGMLDDDGERIEYPYFGTPEGVRFDEDSGSYAAPDASTSHNESIEFFHPVSTVFTALIGAGFVLDQFVEHPFTVSPNWPWLEERPGQTRTYWAPEGRFGVPMMYSVVAHRPA